jgi:bifunctional DNA-binding transcriptional regulator/antitoxin component of YhaV-PrlF toxin-antitoxin module
MKHKPIYKLVDGKGRVLIPKDLRTASGMDYGDIVRLGLSNGTVSVQKINIIEVGDQSPEAVEAYPPNKYKEVLQWIKNMAYGRCAALHRSAVRHKAGAS